MSPHQLYRQHLCVSLFHFQFDDWFISFELCTLGMWIVDLMYCICASFVWQLLSRRPRLWLWILHTVLHWLWGIKLYLFADILSSHPCLCWINYRMFLGSVYFKHIIFLFFNFFFFFYVSPDSQRPWGLSEHVTTPIFRLDIGWNRSV